MSLHVIILSGLVVLGGTIFKLPELGLILCVVAGPLLKGTIQPWLGPIDLTVFLYAVTGGSIFLHLMVKKRQIALPKTPFNLLILAFVSLLLASILYTPLPQYGLEILLRFIFLDVSVLYLVFIWANNEARVKRLLSLFAWVGLIYGSIVFVGNFLAPGRLIYYEFRGVPVTTPPISVALILMVSILIALTLVITQSIKRQSERWTLIALIILSIGELIATNSRGPLIAFAVGLVSLIVILTRSRRWRRYAMLGTIMLIGTGFLTFYILPSQYTARYALIINPASSSISARLNAWKYVASHFYDWFLGGAGLFGFAYYYTGKTTGLSIFGSYPHNIFLDVFADSGIFGLGLFVSIIGYLLLKGWLTIKSKIVFIRALAITSFIGLIAVLVNSLFSMSLIDTRLLWFIGGSILALRRRGEIA